MSPSVPSAADAYTALAGYKAPDAGSVLTQAQGEAGLPAALTRVSDLQGNVSNLQSSLNAVDPSVTGRTSGTFTTEGQRQALVTKEQAPIQTNLTSANSDLGTAVNNENTANSNANAYATAIMGQNQQSYQELLDQYNAAQAYETQQQTEADKAASLAEQAREANLSAAAASSSSGTSAGTSSGSGVPATSAPASSSVNSVQQSAYNNLGNILKGIGIDITKGTPGQLTQSQVNALRSDYAATEKSASYGNTVDKEKLQLYATLFPGTGVSSATLGNGGQLSF